MGRKSIKQLEEEAYQRKSQQLTGEDIVNATMEKPSQEEINKISSNDKIIGDLLQTTKSIISRYKIPEQVSSRKHTIIPKINVNDYPEINVRGSFPIERQKRGANLLILKEIDELLSIIDVGNNRNATLNFLLWVGLQAIKGMEERIDIRVNEKTFADGGTITDFEN